MTLDSSSIARELISDPRIKRITAELERRRYSAVNLWEPLPEQLKFHESKAWQKVIFGSNRAGKTAAAALEVASHLSGKHRWNDQFKNPPRPIRVIAVGLRSESISEVFWQKLFQPGAFFLIKDEHTGEPRAFRPWDENDVARKGEKFPAPALIPSTQIQDIAWADKAKGVWKKVTLVNGNEIVAYTGGVNSNPPQGMDVDIVWFDEEIDNPQFYPELSARLLDRNGLFIWSATPQNASTELFNLYNDWRDGSREINDRPLTECFHARVDSNPHIEEHQREILKEKYKHDPEAYRVRILGEFAIEGQFVFSDFHRDVHLFTARTMLPGGKPPADWTRYMIIDPGHTVCAVLFLAVPNPIKEFGDFVLAYDELYIRNCTPEDFGDAVNEKVGNDVFQEFIIDAHGGLHRGVAGLASPITAYSEQLQKHGIASTINLHGFTYGSDDKQGRVTRARQWLWCSPERNNQPRFKVDEERCPNFIYEIERYTKKKDRGIVLDEPDDKRCGGRNHLMHCFQYAAAHGCSYIAPKPREKALPAVFKAYREWEAEMKKLEEKKEPSHFDLGPATTVPEYEFVPF